MNIWDFELQSFLISRSPTQIPSLIVHVNTHDVSFHVTGVCSVRCTPGCMSRRDASSAETSVRHGHDVATQVHQQLHKFQKRQKRKASAKSHNSSQIRQKSAPGIFRRLSFFLDIQRTKVDSCFQYSRPVQRVHVCSHCIHEGIDEQLDCFRCVGCSDHIFKKLKSSVPEFSIKRVIIVIDPRAFTCIHRRPQACGGLQLECHA